MIFMQPFYLINQIVSVKLSCFEIFVKFSKNNTIIANLCYDILAKRKCKIS